MTKNNKKAAFFSIVVTACIFLISRFWNDISALWDKVWSSGSNFFVAIPDLLTHISTTNILLIIVILYLRSAVRKVNDINNHIHNITFIIDKIQKKKNE